MVNSILDDPIIQSPQNVGPPDAAGSQTVYIAPEMDSGVSFEWRVEAWPSPFLLATLADGRFRILAPFHVIFMAEGDSIVAEATEINEFGFGLTYSEAIRDLQAAIVELCLSLRDDQGNLGPDLLTVWDTLRVKVQIQHAD